MKNKVIATVLLGVFLCVTLTGCVLSTPVGTLTVTYDKNKKTDNVVVTDDDGHTQEIDVKDLNGQIDNMLDDVALPNGATTEDLKDFVHSTTEQMGVQQQIDEIQDALDKGISEANSEDSDTVSEENEENSDTEVE